MLQPSYSSQIFSYLRAKPKGYQFTIEQLRQALPEVTLGAAHGFCFKAAEKGFLSRAPYKVPPAGPDRVKDQTLYELSDPEKPLSIRSTRAHGSYPGRKYREGRFHYRAPLNIPKFSPSLEFPTKTSFIHNHLRQMAPNTIFRPGIIDKLLGVEVNTTHSFLNYHKNLATRLGDGRWQIKDPNTPIRTIARKQELLPPSPQHNNIRDPLISKLLDLGVEIERALTAAIERAPTPLLLQELHRRLGTPSP